MQYFTKDVRPPKEWEVNEELSRTETAGYRPAEVIIGEMIMAGQRLVDYRKQRYEFGFDEKVPEGYYDPTRSPGVDMGTLSQIGRSLSGKLAAQALEAQNGNTGGSGQSGAGNQQSAVPEEDAAGVVAP